MKFLTLLFLATLSGCCRTSQQDSPHAEDTTLIVERDNVKLYRTYDTDRGVHVYFTTKGDVQWTQSNRKSSIRENVGGQ